MNSKMTDLRDHLFATLSALRDKDNPMDLDRASTIADVAQVLVSSAKVEVDYLKVTGAQPDNDFFDVLPTKSPQLIAGERR